MLIVLLGGGRRKHGPAEQMPAMDCSRGQFSGEHCKADYHICRESLQSFGFAFGLFARHHRCELCLASAA